METAATKRSSHGINQYTPQLVTSIGSLSRLGSDIKLLYQLVQPQGLAEGWRSLAVGQ